MKGLCLWPDYYLRYKLFFQTAASFHVILCFSVRLGYSPFIIHQFTFPLGDKNIKNTGSFAELFCDPAWLQLSFSHHHRSMSCTDCVKLNHATHTAIPLQNSSPLQSHNCWTECLHLKELFLQKSIHLDVQQGFTAVTDNTQKDSNGPDSGEF